MKAIVECVPNFSEGRDMGVIRQITDEIEGVEGVQLLNVDAGAAANRTVVTFVGTPEGVAEAAFRAAKKAGEVIDMRCHHGTHPRQGATDVLPLIPVSGISLEACAELARQLARRLAVEAGIPCYCYEASAFRPERRNLAVCRAGEYEALVEKLSDPERRPDFMPEGVDVGEVEITKFRNSEIPGCRDVGITKFRDAERIEKILRAGITVVGARDFLIAVNWNLDTTSVQKANAIAFDVREKGRPGQPGTLKCTKALGWYIDEYGIAQVSMNMTNLNVTPLHVAYEEVKRAAAARSVRVTGTEIVGLVPKSALVGAGRYFLAKQGRHEGVTEDEAVDVAVKTLGLDDLKPFNPREKVIEYLMEES